MKNEAEVRSGQWGTQKKTNAEGRSRQWGTQQKTEAEERSGQWGTVHSKWTVEDKVGKSGLHTIQWYRTT